MSLSVCREDRIQTCYWHTSVGWASHPFIQELPPPQASLVFKDLMSSLERRSSAHFFKLNYLFFCY